MSTATSPSILVTAAKRTLTVAIALVCLASGAADAQSPAPTSDTTAAMSGGADAQSPSPWIAPGATGSAVPSASVTAPAPSSTEARPEDTWVVTAIDASGEGLRPPRRDGSLTVSWLPAGRLEGETACGTYVGGYTIEGDRIRMGVLSPGIEPCGRREEDEAFALTQALGLVTTWAASPAGLALLDDAGSTRVTLVSPDAAAAALAGDWRVRALAGRSGELLAPIQGTDLALSFGPHGQATGSTGCRDFEAGYSIEADRIVIAPISALGLPCEGEQRRQDGRLLSLLGEAFEWRRERERLVLVGADGDVLLEAVALSSPPGSSPTVPPDAPAASATSSPAFALPSSAPDV